MTNGSGGSRFWTPLIKHLSLDHHGYQEIPSADDEEEAAQKRDANVQPPRRSAARFAAAVVLAAVAVGGAGVWYAPRSHHHHELSTAITEDDDDNYHYDVNTDDFIPSIPLYGPPPAPQWSGLLNAGRGGTYLHYWFAHYEGNNNGDHGGGTNRVSQDADIPVIVWFNGGPGSSSLFGWLTELGPLILHQDGNGLLHNPYSWTKVGHVLAIESPAGVGYSYCHNWTLNAAESRKDDELLSCSNTDITTAQDSYAALQDLLTTKFPTLRQNPLYITGESYAGVYVPTLAKEILDGNDEILQSKNDDKRAIVNLQGIGVGDPCTDNTAQAQAFDRIWYAYRHGGLITSEAYKTLSQDCGLVMPHLLTVGRYHGNATKNAQVHQEFQDKIWKRHQEHIRKQAEKHTKDRKPRQNGRRVQETGAYREEYDHKKILNESFQEASEELDEAFENLSRTCRLAYRKFLLTTSRGISQSFRQSYINPYALLEPTNDAYDLALRQYMNRPDVQAIMHVNLDATPVWHENVPHSNRAWDYAGSYDACNWNAVPDGTPSMIDFYRNLAPRLKITMVYNGNADPCVTFEGTEIAIRKVGFDVIEGGEHRPWLYDAPATSADILAQRPLGFGSGLSTHFAAAQLGGHVVNYEHNLTFATVHGSGHMVPQTKPAAALHLLRKLVRQELLTPLIDISDDELTDYAVHEFDDYMRDWTLRAAEAAYDVSSSNDEASAIAAEQQLEP